VIPLLADVNNAKEGFNAATCLAMQKNIVAYGDIVVVTAGAPFGISGTTNTMMVMNIGNVLVRGMPGRGEPVFGKASVIISVDSKKKYKTKDRILVIPKCEEHYIPLLKEAKGIILQNYPDDKHSEELALQIGAKYDIPILTRAENACSIIKHQDEITLDPQRGMVVRGDEKIEEARLAGICNL
jgi:pyruvate kinase